MQFEVGQFGAEEPVELYKSEFLMSTRVWEKKDAYGNIIFERTSKTLCFVFKHRLFQLKYQ